MRYQGKKMTKIVGLTLTGVMLAGMMTACAPAQTEEAKAESFVSIDVNPSISLVLDEDDKVLSVIAENEDAQVLVYEENAFAPDSFPDNRPGAVWKLRPGMADKVKRLGGLASDSTAHYEIVERYRTIIKDTLGNYDYMQGDYSTNVSTATGLAILSDMASARKNAKNVCKKAGFAELYRLIDIFALEFFTKEKAELVLGGGTKTSTEYFAEYGYIPKIDVRIRIGDGVENSRSFTATALAELAAMSINEENYPLVRAYINALDIPEKSAITAELDEKFTREKGE